MEKDIFQILMHDPIKWANLLKKDKTLFKYHKKFMHNQWKKMQKKNEYFQKRFGTGETFKQNARKYLKNIGVIK